MMKKLFLVALVFWAAQSFAQVRTQDLPGRTIADTLNFGTTPPVGPVKDSLGVHRTALNTKADSAGIATRAFVAASFKDSIANHPSGSIDTTSLSNRINLKADSTDRATRTYVGQVAAGKLANADSTDRATRTYVGQIAAGKLANADSADRATRTYVGQIAGLYLPLSGGTLTGTLNLTANPAWLNMTAATGNYAFHRLKSGAHFWDIYVHDGIASGALSYAYDAGASQLTLSSTGDLAVSGQLSGNTAVIGTLSGTVRATAGGLSATASDTVGLGAALGAKADSTDRATRTYVGQVAAGKLANADSTDKATRTYVGAVVGPKMDSTRVNVLRGTDSTRTIVREGAKVAYVDSANLFMPRAQITTALALKQNSLVTGQATFSGTNARIAVYVAGVTTASIFVGTPISANGTTAPTLVNLVHVFLKTDSLIFIRGASGTSGLKVNYMGIK
jgi:hypothetical protein